MSKNDMLAPIVRALVCVPQERLGIIFDTINKIGGADGELWRKRFAEALREGVKQTTKNILEFIGTTVIPATTAQFVAKGKFVRNTGHKAKVKISYLGDNFTEWFLSGDSKTEDPISEQTLCSAKLKKSSVDAPIIAELGGEAKAETALTEVFSLMEKQPNGENGALLTNGYANIFYVRDQHGVLRAVRVGWDDGGWDVRAGSVEIPDMWHDGSRVFSRNSVLDPSATVSAQA